MSKRTVQRDLFDLKPLNKAVNVASINQRSPFRYPGGKTWLIPRIRQWVESLKIEPAEFIEPFAGGGIVSLTVAAERLARHVTMVELDDQVAAVWQTIIEDGDGLWLAERIVNFNLTLDALKELLSKKTDSVKEQAFQTILKNRTYRGGILAPGSAPLKNGENGKGISSRWYPNTLKNRILNIDAIREQITFIKGDGLGYIKQNSDKRNVIFFIDPPYTAAGKRAGSRLYAYWKLDHENLFAAASKIRGDFLMTYDKTEEVQDLARKYGFDYEPVAMKNTHHAEMTELLIGRNLDWARSQM